MTVKIISLFDIKLYSVPLINNDQKFIVVLTVASDSFLSRATWKLSKSPNSFLRINFNSTYHLPVGLSLKTSDHKFLWLFSFPMRSTFPVYFIFVNFVVQIIFNEDYRLSSLCDSVFSNLSLFPPFYFQIFCWTYSFWTETNWFSNFDNLH